MNIDVPVGPERWCDRLAGSVLGFQAEHRDRSGRGWTVMVLGHAALTESTGELGDGPDTEHGAPARGARVLVLDVEHIRGQRLVLPPPPPTRPAAHRV